MEFEATHMGSGKYQLATDAMSVSVLLEDGALDTLGAVLRTMGEEAFPVDDDQDIDRFRQQCDELAKHVEQGAAVPSVELAPSAGRERHWGSIRRFFRDRRRSEKEFVNHRLADYRAIVDDLVGGLREIGRRDEDTATCVHRNLKAIEAAVATGNMAEINSTLNSTMRNISHSFTRQKQDYERRINELNQRMNKMREDLVHAREEMKRDALTGAFNRGAFDSAIIHSLNLNFILDQPVTVILIDLDNFKAVNDGHGHAAGDAVLRAFGNFLARLFIRKNDIVARYGGDEFAVILADTTAEDTATLLGRFYADLAELPLPDLGQDFRLSASAGYTEIAPGDSVEVLLERADSALYGAKKAGRGRYEYAPAPAAARLSLTGS